eukprot:scaffold35416_cov24-Phaeocystis_antarctica.AAC.1
MRPGQVDFLAHFADRGAAASDLPALVDGVPEVAVRPCKVDFASDRPALTAGVNSWLGKLLVGDARPP